MLIQINLKKQIDGEKPIFDLQGPTPITFKLDQDFSSISASLYLAGSRVYKDSSKLLFLSTDYSINENEITFIVDTYTENYLKYISEYKTPFNLEFGAFSDSKTIFLLDKAFANPRVYVEGVPPAPVDEYYTKSEADAKFLTILSSHQLYYTKEQSDERYLSGGGQVDLSGYLKLDDPKPISGDLYITHDLHVSNQVLTVGVAANNIGVETINVKVLRVNGNVFYPSAYLPISGGNVDYLTINNVEVIPSSYALKSELNNYLPISGGNVDYLTISGIPVDPRGGGGEISGYLPLTGSIISERFELNENINPNYLNNLITVIPSSQSVSIGYHRKNNSEIFGNRSMAFGSDASASGTYSTAIGYNARAINDQSLVLGWVDYDQPEDAKILLGYGGSTGAYMDDDYQWHFTGDVTVSGTIYTPEIVVNGVSFDPDDYVSIDVLENYLPLSGGDVEQLTINGEAIPTFGDLEDYITSEDLENYVTFNDLDDYATLEYIGENYLPLSGGDVEQLTINGDEVALVDDLNDYMPISGGTFEGEVSLPSAIVSSLIQNGVNYNLAEIQSSIPLSTSQLINDSGFITGGIDPTSITGFVNYFDQMPNAAATSAEVAIYSGNTITSSGFLNPVKFIPGHIYKKGNNIQPAIEITVNLDNEFYLDSNLSGRYIVSGWNTLTNVRYLVWDDEEYETYHYETASSVTIPSFENHNDSSYTLEFTLDGQNQGGGEWWFNHNGNRLLYKHLEGGLIDYSDWHNVLQIPLEEYGDDWYEYEQPNTYYMYVNVEEVFPNRWNDITPCYMKEQKIDFNLNTTLSSNMVFKSNSYIPFLNLTIPSGLTNTLVFFRAGTSFNYTITIDDGMYINQPFDFSPSGSYLITVEDQFILWTEMQPE